jgi:hypothetical protein
MSAQFEAKYAGRPIAALRQELAYFEGVRHSASDPVEALELDVQVYNERLSAETETLSDDDRQALVDGIATAEAALPDARRQLADVDARIAYLASLIAAAE